MSSKILSIFPVPNSLTSVNTPTKLRPGDLVTLQNLLREHGIFERYGLDASACTGRLRGGRFTTILTC